MRSLRGALLADPALVAFLRRHPCDPIGIRAALRRRGALVVVTATLFVGGGIEMDTRRAIDRGRDPHVWRHDGEHDRRERDRRSTRGENTLSVCTATYCVSC